MRSADPIRFEPSEPYQDLARIVALLDANYVGTLAERPDGAFEFIPYRSGPFCIALRLSDGPHIAVSFKAMEAVVWRLMKDWQAHDQLAAYVPVRPNGTAWTRTFASEAAAWRIVIGARTAQAALRIVNLAH